MHRADIGVGSNLDDPLRQVRLGIVALRELGTLVASSSLYRSAPWGRVDQPEFVNAVVRIETALTPHRLLASLKALEQRLGRMSADRWGPRRIDFDILTYEGVQLQDEELTLPHPHLFERAFVLVPLAQIDPAYRAACERLPQRQRDQVLMIS